MIESIIGQHNSECASSRALSGSEREYKTVLHVELAAAERVTWYNNDRLQSAIGIVPPVEHENTHYFALNREQSGVSERHHLPNG